MVNTGDAPLPAGARVTEAVGDNDGRSVALYSRDDKRSSSSHSEHMMCNLLCECARGSNNAKADAGLPIAGTAI